MREEVESMRDSEGSEQNRLMEKASEYIVGIYMDYW